MLGLLIMVAIFVAALSEPLYLGPYLSVLVLINVAGLRLNRNARHVGIKELTASDSDGDDSPARTLKVVEPLPK